jgi:hypothetical protein
MQPRLGRHGWAQGVYQLVRSRHQAIVGLELA